MGHAHRGQIERLRELQRSGTGRAESFAVLSEVYYWLAGRLFEAAEVAGRADLEQAFSVMEGMRARVLLDALESEPAAQTEDNPLRRELEVVRKKLVAVNRRLLDPDVGLEERATAVEESERLRASGWAPSSSTSTMRPRP